MGLEQRRELRDGRRPGRRRSSPTRTPSGPATSTPRTRWRPWSTRRPPPTRTVPASRCATPRATCRWTGPTTAAATSTARSRPNWSTTAPTTRIASFAKSLGKTADYTKFATRAQDWMNVFNPQTGYMQGKNKRRPVRRRLHPRHLQRLRRGHLRAVHADGAVRPPGADRPPAAARRRTPRTSTACWRTSPSPAATNANLSNEPSLEIPWEYDYLGQPWKTQEAVRQAQQKLYFNAPVGSFGNDDLGAMSSWYVWSELGMYPETPGTDTLALRQPGLPGRQDDLRQRQDGRRSTPRRPPRRAVRAGRSTSTGKKWNDVLADLRPVPDGAVAGLRARAPCRAPRGPPRRRPRRRRTPPAASGCSPRPDRPATA